MRCLARRIYCSSGDIQHEGRLCNAGDANRRETRRTKASRNIVPILHFYLVRFVSANSKGNPDDQAYREVLHKH
jgi:hypothetical protein